jgi:hypothetical protein
MPRKRKKNNYQKLKEAHILNNELYGALLAFTTGELPRNYTLQQLVFKNYGDKYTEMLHKEST